MESQANIEFQYVTKDTNSKLDQISSPVSPVDSGVQLLDSESDITSVMSMSGTTYDLETPNTIISVVKTTSLECDGKFPKETNVMTKSDIANQNTTVPLDYVYSTSAPSGENKMHVSMSEEMKEIPKLETKDEQIVFRRQRKKKSSKSDTPKKRVSFHEDILNSTRTNDIHIEHGFITHESEGFFNWDSTRKRDVVQGRYSWAAEGDTPYYHSNVPEREVKSEMFIRTRYSTSSSGGSVDSSSSSNSLSESTKLPKSSCLKKRSNRIDTQIVQEDSNRKSESNLLDSNLFGSLKNILSFTSNVSLAERGVPEGQEDFTDLTNAQQKRNCFAASSSSSSSSLITKSLDRDGLKLGLKTTNVPVPENVILCDSNVYEHKGISYSYEYDKFQRSLENEKTKPKSSTIYQMLLNDLNFFKKKEKSEQNSKRSVPDWCSDTETISDYSETNSSKHLTSPKHKYKPNHYSVAQIFKPDAEFGLKPGTSKSSLINRFLRNVTMKKLLDAKLVKKQKLNTNKCMGLYLKGVKPVQELCDNIDKQLDEELRNGMKNEKVTIEQQLSSNVLIKLKKEVFRDAQEKFINYYKVTSTYTETGETKPLIVFLTNTTLYITGSRVNQHQQFRNQFVLPYQELNTILIGPNAQSVLFSNADREMQYFITTGSSDVTNELIAQLEITIRKQYKYNGILRAVRHLTMREMLHLKSAICKQTTVDKDEEYFHYSIVNVQDLNTELVSTTTPLGPAKKGPLMFKTANEIRWETGYFILKAGVLYILSSPSNRLPLRVLPLGGGACLGAYRTPYCLRPHTFELRLIGMILHLAAPDEYVASEWLQVLVQAASGLYNSHETNCIQSCTLLLTSQHILTMREKFPDHSVDLDSKPQALSCAAIADLISFRIPLVEQSWCILEFACREVHEISGDLVVYFATNAELERFISTLEMLWTYNNNRNDSFPLHTLSDNETVTQRCIDSFRMLQNAWSSVHLWLQ